MIQDLAPSDTGVEEAPAVALPRSSDIQDETIQLPSISENSVGIAVPSGVPEGSATKGPESMLGDTYYLEVDENEGGLVRDEDEDDDDSAGEEEEDVMNDYEVVGGVSDGEV